MTICGQGDFLTWMITIQVGDFWKEAFVFVLQVIFTRWCQLKYFCLFSTLPGEMIQFDEHIFQMGWFNHQLVHGFDLLGYITIKPQLFSICSNHRTVANLSTGVCFFCTHSIRIPVIKGEMSLCPTEVDRPWSHIWETYQMPGCFQRDISFSIPKTWAFMAGQPTLPLTYPPQEIRN